MSIFSLKEVLFFKITDILILLNRKRQIKRSGALRLFSFDLSNNSELKKKENQLIIKRIINEHRLQIILRKSSSDIAVFNQVIINEAYKTVLKFISSKSNPIRIIDAGANIGLASLFFKAFMPGAEIIAIEPNKNNLNQLTKNFLANGLDSGMIVPKGLYKNSGFLFSDISFRDGDFWSFTLKENEDREGAEIIDVISMADILNIYQWKRIDLLKLDIEGGEAVLFKDESFLRILKDKVVVLAVELHEEAINDETVSKLLYDLGFFFFNTGDLKVCVNTNLVSNLS